MRSSFPTPAISRRPLHMMPWHSLHRLERILGLLPMAFVISPFIFWRWLIYCWTFYPVYPIDLLCCGAKRIWGYNHVNHQFSGIYQIYHIYIYLFHTSLGHSIPGDPLAAAPAAAAEPCDPTLGSLDFSHGSAPGRKSWPTAGFKMIKTVKKNRSRW